jgi:cyclohexadienyl dehydratase
MLFFHADASRAMRFALALALCLAPALGRAEPVLRVGTSGDYAPFSLRGAGFDIDVANDMARDLGVRIQWVPFRWPELRERMRRGDFDLAMSGVTWLPERAVVGRSSRAVAAGGPCVVGDPGSNAIAVNRGGRLERWARTRFAADAVLPIDENLALPTLLEGGAAGAFVTDSFELRSRRLPDVAVRCEPPTERKVYWISPARAADLGARIDAWLAANEPAIDELRRRWLGGSAPRDAVDDLLDRITRRIDMMPAVAAAKHARGLAIEDRARETRVLEHARDSARSRGLDPESIESLFRVQIELAKAIEGRAATGGAPTLDLETELRPALLLMSDDIVASLAASAPISEQELRGERLALLRPLLQEDEIMALRRAIAAVVRASR